MTAGKAVPEGRVVHRIGTRAERADRVAAMLERMGLLRSTFARRLQALSGGQRQRVGIARVLVFGSELLIADEAGSALDVSVQAATVNL